MVVGRSLGTAVTQVWLSLVGRARKEDASPGGQAGQAGQAAAAEPVPAAVPASPEPEGPSRLVQDTVVTMTQLVLPSDSSKDGTLLAGPLLKWIDICACMSAERFSGTNCVTASMEDIHFLQKVGVGEIVKLEARVHQAWNTSMEVGVAVTIERLGEGNSKPVLCCHAMSTFVSRDKKLLPRLDFSSEEERGSAERADARKAIRMKMPKKQEEARPQIAEGTTVSTELVMPHHCQHMGTTFGGWIMQWMECTASIAAARHTRLPMACASTDTVNFLAPSYAGNAVEFRALVTCVWRTSIEVGCWASAEDLREGTSKPVCQMYATYVLSSREAPVALPPLRASDDSEAPRSAGAYQRRAARLQRKSLQNLGGELSVDAAAFDERAARAAVRDLQELAAPQRRPSDAGGGIEASLSWETLFDGTEHGLPVHVDAMEGYPATCIRICFSLGACPEDVDRAVNDFGERRSWDAIVVGAESLRRPPQDDRAPVSSFQPTVPVEIEMLRMVLSTGHDVTVGRARMCDEASGTRTSVSRSIRHPDAPPVDGARRIEVLPSGWVLRPDGEGGCKAVYSLQLGASALGVVLGSMDGQMMNSADLAATYLNAKEKGLAGSGGVLMSAIMNVITLMRKFPPQPQAGHPHTGALAP